MVESSYDLLHPGVTRYHHIGLVVPLLASISVMYLTRVFKNVNTPHHVVRALLFGVIVAVVSYGLMSYGWFKEEKHALNKAVLLGLLVAELAIFSVSEKIPSVVMIMFFLFMYVFGTAEVHQR
jgi:phosphatidylserine synthase